MSYPIENCYEDFSRAIAYGGRGDAYFAVGDREKAIADLTQALRLDPNNDLIHLNLGVDQAQQGNLAEAIAFSKFSARSS